MFKRLSLKKSGLAVWLTPKEDMVIINGLCIPCCMSEILILMKTINKFGLFFGFFLMSLLFHSNTAMGKVYLSEEEAPQMVFPEAEEVERKVIESTPELREEIKRLIGKPEPSLWEKEYTTFIAKKDGKVIGYAVIVEEIGKHRPITFIIEVTPEGEIGDIAIMAYREPYGGEIRSKRFLKQYDGKNLDDPIETRKDIVNISGATLSVRAANRAIKKALAIIGVVYLSKHGHGIVNAGS